MRTFQQMAELLTYLLKNEPTQELTDDMLFAMNTVETCLKCGVQAKLVIATAPLNEEEERTLGIGSGEPELDEKKGLENEVWRKRIFIFSDDGAGVILYERLSPCV